MMVSDRKTKVTSFSTVMMSFLEIAAIDLEAIELEIAIENDQEAETDDGRQSAQTDDTDSSVHPMLQEQEEKLISISRWQTI